MQYGPTNNKHLIWASLRFLLGRHLQTTFEHTVGKEFSVEFTTEPFFLTQISYVVPKSEYFVCIRLFLDRRPTLYVSRTMHTFDGSGLLDLSTFKAYRITSCQVHTRYGMIRSTLIYY